MSLRNRIFLVFALAFAISVYGLFSWLRSDLMPRYLEAQEDILVDLSHLLAAGIETDGLVEHEGRMVPDVTRLDEIFRRVDANRFEARVYSLLKTQVEVRVYVTDATGTVIFDSDGGRDLGHDYSLWRDVRLTLEGAYGARSTRDDPLLPGGSTMYIAAPIRDAEGIVGVLSVGRTTANAERFLESALRRFALACALALAGALLLAFVLYRWVSRPLRQLHDYAHALQGGVQLPPPRLRDKEMERVGTAMAELRSALDGKSYVENYVQALTHELKSPVAAIAGAAELLGEELPEAERQRFLDNVRRESHRLGDLVERTLALAAIENQRALNSLEPLDLAALMHEVAERSLAQREVRGLRLELDMENVSGATGDPFLAAQAIHNLIVNAVAHSPPGSEINVTLHREGGAAVIRVRDQGPGVPDYARERIFERFYALPCADGTKGTGLGLAFVRQIMALHGGTVALEPTTTGACFRLDFPLGSVVP